MKIIDIIEYEGNGQPLVWKHPAEDFNTFTQLIVHETQEAVFFRNGQALDLFGPGRYTLKTQNIPLLRKIINIPTDGNSPFHCEVYFFNKAEQMALKWGTDSKVQYIDPIYGFPLSIGASGELNLRVADSKKLLVKIVGTKSLLDQNQLLGYFRAFVTTRIKSYIASVMKKQQINIFEVDEQLNIFSNEVKALLAEDLGEYGVSLERFFITSVVKPDGEPQYEAFKALHFRKYADVAEAKLRQQVSVIDQQTNAQKIVIESQAMAQKRVQEGYTYQQERGFDIAEQAAKNESVGQFTNIGVGIGAMAGVGGAIGTLIGDTVHASFSEIGRHPTEAPTKATGDLFCENCGAPISIHTSFCEKCGFPQSKVRMDTCQKCGFIFERPGNFCPKCGSERVKKQS